MESGPNGGGEAHEPAENHERGSARWDLDPDESADLAESLVRLTGPVMVVDDEPMVRKSLANAIERIGARVMTAADGEEALRKFRELHNPLIFADVRMPGLDGVGLLRCVKSLVPQTERRADHRLRGRRSWWTRRSRRARATSLASRSRSPR